MSCEESRKKQKMNNPLASRAFMTETCYFYQNYSVCYATEVTMKKIDLKVATELKKRLSGVVELVDFKVFGSRARGDADEYSDMDVFLEVEYLDRNIKERIADITWEVGYENYMVISPLIFTRDELEHSALRSSPIVKCITEEGVRL